MSNPPQPTDETLGNLCRRYIAAYKALHEGLDQAENPCSAATSPWHAPWMQKSSELFAAHVDVVRAFTAYPGAYGLVEDGKKLWRFGAEGGAPINLESILVLRPR